MNQHCKHKVSFISGDESMLCDSEQKSFLAEVADWISQTALLQAVSELESKLKEIEKAKKKLDEESKQAKADFARKLCIGFA